MTTVWNSVLFCAWLASKAHTYVSPITSNFIGLNSTLPNTAGCTPNAKRGGAFSCAAANLLVQGVGMSIASMVDEGRRERNRKATLRRIEQSAWTLFQEQGYEATTTRQLAQHAEIGIGTLFNYFPEKRTLLVHLMRRRLDRSLVAAIESMPELGVMTQLDHIFSCLYRCYEEDRRLARTFVKEWLFVSGSPESQPADWAFMLVQHIASMIVAAQQRGEIQRQIDAMQLAQQIFSTHYFTLVTWLGGTIPSPAARDQQLSDSLVLLFRGLGTANAA